ncbi:lasso peptide biosynthesis B2 protein [soil metagenome]
MPDTLWCAPGIHLTIIDQDVVVLDLGADRYHCLLDGAGLLKPEPDGRIAVADDETAEALIASALADQQPLIEARRDVIPAARELLLAANPSAGDVLQAATMWAVAAFVFRGRSLAALTDYHAAVRDRAQSLDEARLAEVVGAARTARSWVPFEGECLKRSFQLRCVLAAQGIACDWVFGVRTWPFAAHCWLQIGDLVVGDRLDRVRRYTPIMSV